MSGSVLSQHTDSLKVPTSGAMCPSEDRSAGGAKRALAREERISARYLVLDAGCDLPKLSYQTPTSALPSPFCSSSRRV